MYEEPSKIICEAFHSLSRLQGCRSGLMPGDAYAFLNEPLPIQKPKMIESAAHDVAR